MSIQKGLIASLLLSFFIFSINAQNLINNSGFESWENNLPKGWNINGSDDKLVLGQESGIKYEGDYSLKIGNKGSRGDVSIYTPNIPIEAGKTYRYSFSYHVDETTINENGLRYWGYWLDDLGKKLESPELNPSGYESTDKKAKWITFVKDITAVSGSDSIRLEIRIYNNTTVYIDDVRLTEVTENTPVINIDFSYLLFNTPNLNKTVTKTVNVKAKNLSQNLSVKIEGDSEFSSENLIPKIEAESNNGYNLLINYTPSAYTKNKAVVIIESNDFLAPLEIELEGNAYDPNIQTADNLVKNYSFEVWENNSPIYWTVTEGDAYESTDATDGKLSIELDGVKKLNQQITTDFTTGDEYEIIFDYKLLSGNARIYSYWQNTSGNIFGDDIILRPNIYLSASDSWKNIKLETTVPDDVTGFLLEFRGYDSPSFFMDNIIFRKKYNVGITLPEDNQDLIVRVSPGYININTQGKKQPIEIYNNLGQLIYKKIISDNESLPVIPGQLIIIKTEEITKRIITK